jgi:hypothetical protein
MMTHGDEKHLLAQAKKVFGEAAKAGDEQAAAIIAGFQKDYAATLADALFPFYTLSEKGKRRHLRTLLDRDYSEWIQDGIIKQSMAGLNLCWTYFPHQWSVKCAGMLSPMEVFRHHLPDALTRHRALGGTCETASGVRKALKTYSGAQGVSGFRPSSAAALFHRYLPATGGVTWDMCAGWGGRLLGALVSPQVLKYIGTDPSSPTFKGLCEMRDELPRMLNGMGYPAPLVDIQCKGSEDFRPEPGSLDLCFTSPPYGPGHEKYSDEPTQSSVRFPTNDRWMHGYMRMTLENCRVGLKRDGFLVMNLANTKTYPTLTRDFLSLAKDTGFTLVETLQLALSKMVGTDKQTASHKFEPIFAFRKS